MNASLNDERSAAFSGDVQDLYFGVGIEGFVAEDRLVPMRRHASISGIPSTSIPDPSTKTPPMGRKRCRP